MPVGARWAGIADAGVAVVGKGWLNWIDWVVLWFWALPLLWPCPAPLGAIDWIVVKVVVKDRTDGAGLEKVLSPPLLDSTPPPTVRLVPAKELAPWLGAVIDRDASWSVNTVPAKLLLPTVGGA